MRYSITKTSVFAFVCGVFVAIPAARAATITVTSDSGGTGGPDCTLRDAITAANTDAPTGGCPAGNGADTIELPADATITLRQVDNDTNGLNGLPSVISEININGSGTAIQRDGSAPDFRIFHIGASGNLTLNDLTVSGGVELGDFPANRGGGIYNGSGSELTLAKSTVSGNSAYHGGGIWSFGELTMNDSTVSENVAAFGGAIRNANGTVTLTDSTVNGNFADFSGGGIFNSGTLTLTTGNISGNTASGSNGGGIFNTGTGTVTLTASIVNGNFAGFPGGGIWNGLYGTLILSDNTICANTPDQIDGDYTDDGGNLIEDECPPCVSSDFNGDGIVEAADLAELLGDWGPCP
ncbi:MAG: hypothetical protein IID41_13385 [Planctomycetes bacterium]|nr:hypothetical protein [Planctomycetota bacterium]